MIAKECYSMATKKKITARKIKKNSAPGKLRHMADLKNLAACEGFRPWCDKSEGLDYEQGPR